MADLKVNFAGIQSPNPFWLASAPPTNTGDQVMRAFDAGWGGAVWKTLGNPIVNVTSRFGAVDYGSTKMMGLNNIELITDRPLEVNLREIREVKRRYPKHAVIAFTESLMAEVRQQKVRVSVVMPGSVSTTMRANMRSFKEGTEPEWMLTADDVAAAVEYLVGQPDNAHAGAAELADHADADLGLDAEHEAGRRDGFWRLDHRRHNALCRK